MNTDRTKGTAAAGWFGFAFICVHLWFRFFSARIGGAVALFDWLSLEGEEAGSCAKHLSFKTGKPGVIARAFAGSGKEDRTMIFMLIIRLIFVGRISALIVWIRKSPR